MLSELLVQLSKLLRPALGLPVAGPVSISMPLAQFAARRHRVAPLLFGASKATAHDDSDGAALKFLEATYQANAKRRLRQQAALKTISGIFEDADIAFWPLKGEGLARQLMDDPNMRWAKDIDVLIAPRDASIAIKNLQRNGYRAADRVKQDKVARPRMERFRMAVGKDESYRDPDFGQLIELHQRCFYAEPAGLSNWFQEQWPARSAPEIDNIGLLFYLLLHGALTRWSRMKWIADLSLVVRTLDRQMLAELMDVAERFNCCDAIIASLTWVEHIFPGSLQALTLGKIKSEFACRPKSRQISDQFMQAIADDETGFRAAVFPTPAWHIFDNAGMKVFLTGYVPVASMARRL